MSSEYGTVYAIPVCAFSTSTSSMSTEDVTVIIVNHYYYYTPSYYHHYDNYMQFLVSHLSLSNIVESVCAYTYSHINFNVYCICYSSR